MTNFSPDDETIDGLVAAVDSAAQSIEDFVSGQSSSYDTSDDVSYGDYPSDYYSDEYADNSDFTDVDEPASTTTTEENSHIITISADPSHRISSHQLDQLIEQHLTVWSAICVPCI